jgi:alkylation response protein AidB-like acyl-CoA dehydrogenase
VEPAQFVQAVQELARADAATAWCSMIASTTSLLGAFLSPEQAATIFDGGRTVGAGVFAPRGRAERRDGGYVVSGRWSFVSGVQHSSWVMAGCIVYDGETPELLPSGSPDVRLMAMPIESLDVLDTWSVAGLRGTGSHDVTVSEEPVPAERSVSLFTERPRESGALYSFPLFGLLSMGVAAVALGIARGAIDDLIALAGGKKPTGSLKPLAQRASVQADVSRAEAGVRAAHALLLAEARGAWAGAQAGQGMTTERRMSLRLAATHAIGQAAGAVNLMYNAGGGTSIYDESPLQRRFRDVHVATQHMMVGPATLELTGRILLGLPTDTAQL